MELNEIAVFQDLPEKTIKWFLDRAEIIELDKDEYVYQPGVPADHLVVVLEGQFEVLRVNAGGKIPVAVVDAGIVTGRLPYSRMKEVSAFARVVKPVKIMRLHKKHFADLGYESTELMQRLVGLMSDRVRTSTRMQQQEEKLASLGKLSAGLAHEINNPASAINRTATNIRQEIKSLPELVSKMFQFNLKPETFENINAIIFNKCTFGTTALSVLEKSELEDELIDWMEDHDVEEAFDLAEVFVKTGLTPPDLDALKDIIPEGALSPVLLWIQKMLDTEKLSVEIHEASTRISELVGAIKTYSHMDRSPDFEMTNLVSGVESTLTMLNHKVRDKKIELVKEFEEVPTIKAMPSELNQVWTNIIDNAIDAAPEQDGKILVEAKRKKDTVRIRISDNGPGIPEDIKSKIFDPFFTTKAVGKGTGLGLDIVQRIIKTHNAGLEVDSEPGRTTFEVCFPIK